MKQEDQGSFSHQWKDRIGKWYFKPHTTLQSNTEYRKKEREKKIGTDRENREKKQGKKRTETQIDKDCKGRGDKKDERNETQQDP